MTELTLQDKTEILRYSGYHNGIEITNVSNELIEKCIERVNKIATIRTNWKLFDIEEVDEGVLLRNYNVVLRGESIKKHLKNCSQAVLMCGTIGPQFDREVSKVMLTDAAAGVYMNSCGIVLIEKVMDDLQISINSALPSGHTGLRFSPGYGDMPLQNQQDFMNLLNMERVVGIRLGVSYLMNPEKSVTAVSGIRYDDIIGCYEDTNCTNCNLECNKRKQQ